MGQVENLRDLVIVNCTPHPINLLATESFLYKQIKPVIKISFPQSNYIARVQYRTSLVERIIVNNTVIDVTTTKYNEVLGLPRPKKGTIYLVSKLVAETLYGKRDDLYILSGFARNDAGVILGGRSLAKLTPLRIWVEQ